MRYVPSALFFGFICIIIVLADTDHKLHVMKYFEKVPYADKAGHFLLFGVLAGLLNFSLGFRHVIIASRSTNLAAALVLAFALLEEFSQLAFESRSFDLLDIFSDVVGVWFFVQLSEWISNRMASKRNTI